MSSEDKLEPYWEKKFSIEDNIYNVKLFQYSPKSIVMVTCENFGRKFSHVFKEAGGRFNSRLSTGPGWVFKLTDQENLTQTLIKIYKKEIKPKQTDIRVPIFDDSATDNKIFNTLQELLSFIPEETEERILSETEDAVTTIYYNKNEDTVTKGEMIYNFTSAHKSVEIYQLRL